MAPSRGRKSWQTSEGYAHIRKIVEEKIPEWTGGLHDWQIMVVAWILDGEDVLCITATGDGKSAIFAVPMIVLLEVARNPTAYPGYVHHKKPVGIVISPTKGLSTNIVYELAGLRVPALAFSSDTLTEARKSGRNLGTEIAECRWPIICVDPEHLIDKQWERITDAQLFRENIVFAGVDEAHLIPEWGAEFRPAYRHIGAFFRGRLPPQISVFALTATAQPGAMTKSICRSLGFTHNSFRLLRRSNERTNIQFILAPLTHGLGGTEFPDLLRYLKDGRKCIIYCATIELCWRVFIYLFRLLPPGGRLRRLRLYHALCWPHENEETIALMRDDPLCQVIVATVAFGQGINLKTILDCIQLGVPKTVAQTLQQGGRAVRDLITPGRTMVLAQASAYTAAQKFLDSQSSGSKPPKSKSGKTLTTMNNEKALMLTVKECLIAFFNKIYGNSTPGALLDCIALPRSLPCSNCLPRFIGPWYFPPSPLPPDHRPLAPFRTPTPLVPAASAPAEKQRKLTKKMRTTAELRLQGFRNEIYMLERDNESHGFAPVSSYFSNPTITLILDNFFRISSANILSNTIPKWKHHLHHGSSLLTIILSLREDFEILFELARLERNKQNRIRGQAKRKAAAEPSEADNSESEEVMEEEVDEPPEQLVQPVRAKRVLEDVTNAPSRPKRARQGLQSAAEVSSSFKPPYALRSTRRRDTENPV